MYTIKEAAARSGVGAPLIRAWERRYGVVDPVRTASGYRLYDDATVAVLRAMRALVDSGWTASEAARAIRVGEIEIGSVATEGPAVSEAAANRARMIDRFVRAAETTSPSETEAALDEILAAGSFEAVIDDVLLPAAAALGDLWAAGRLSVAAEHAASGAVLRRLAAIYQAAGVPQRPSVVVGLPPGSRHELGALAFAAALRRRRVGVLYIGSDVPIDSWLDVIGQTRATAAVVAIVTANDRSAAGDVVRALQDRGDLTIAIGGAAADRDLSRSNGIVVLPARVTDAAEAMVAAIGRRR
jgi:DNA-binding transcriptional MerR regulator/methylmalonyl-CoA mutase cobalamin-binding subunit